MFQILVGTMDASGTGDASEHSTSTQCQDTHYLL